MGVLQNLFPAASFSFFVVSPFYGLTYFGFGNLEPRACGFIAVWCFVAFLSYMNIMDNDKLHKRYEKAKRAHYAKEERMQNENYDPKCNDGGGGIADFGSFNDWKRFYKQ